MGTEKVYLREKRLEDAPDDYAWRKDPDLARLDAAAPLTAKFSDYLAAFREELEHPTPNQRRFAIDAKDGTHIGNCMYYDIDTRRSEAELGIMIGKRAYWNQGLGTEAVRALLRHIFTDTALQRVHLKTLAWNKRAQRCFQKSGLRECQRLQRNGQRFVVMEICREDVTGVQEQAAD